MSKSRRYSIIGLCALLFIVLITWYFTRTAQVAVPPAIAHGYSKALKQARNGEPGAARVLYQQLGRPDLSDVRRAALHAELPNYPSPQALKLADKDLANEAPLVRQAAIHSVVGLVPSGQRTLLLGPLLEDPEQSVRFAAANALLGLSPDTLGLYFGPLQRVLDEFEKQLKGQPESAEGWIQLARLYIHNARLAEAQSALEQALRLEPDNLPAVVAQIELLDKQGKVDDSRQLLAAQLQAHPESAYLQHALGMWLLHHGEREYALLGLSKAVELEPGNQDYRYDLATTLHAQQELEAAQRQLEEIVQRHPENRKARVLLVNYWTESGQLQNVQVLLAQLEQQNPDDPALQQGL
ncbi:tetratricopeptide repeat protein [Pseudomonas sp. CCM 7893]|uniref:Tetratricopeptide repeat protein n=1 Tax=Pseudomonas spelaei TaxID=1055469 RepID=A0A6I3WAA2_9PSED|nr:HEAT repeat domain-containing protein [Pseudomonas spelaei]MUF04189.1 tetratricopeptide repeat protein [Pseudomonas spelaei]